MATETTGSEGTGTPAAATEGVPESASAIQDILVENADSTLALADAKSDAAGGDPAAADIAAEGGKAAALELDDVLAGVVPEGADAGELGAYIRFDTVDGNTVISIDADGPGAAVPVVTLHGVTDVTLQDLLNTTPIIT